MRKHEVEVPSAVADSILDGECRLCVALNEPQYQKGDHVAFVARDGMLRNYFHKVTETEYSITYVMTHYGLNERFVAFGFAEIGGNREQ